MVQARGPFAKIYRSLWDGTLGPRRNAWDVFVFMLAHADAQGRVDMTPEAIAARGGIPPADVSDGIAILEAPDARSHSQEAEGRRLVRLDQHRDCGWQIINYRAYREGNPAEWSATYRDRHQEQVRESDRERKQRVRQVSVRCPLGVREQAEAEVEAEAPIPSLPKQPHPTTVRPRASRSAVGAARTSPDDSANGPVIPEWLDGLVWKDWCDFRKRIPKVPWSLKAMELSIAALDRLRADGYSPRLVVDQSILNGWRGLFPVKPPRETSPPTADEEDQEWRP